MQTFPEHARMQAQRYLSFALDMILPPRCVVSGNIVETQGMISPKAWAELDFIATPLCECCGFPFDFEVDGEALCTACLAYPPRFESARAALKYNDASRHIILGFKHADKTHLVKTFVPWLMRVGEEMVAEGDVIVPVPLHRWRLIGRRYNQAALIGQALAQETGVAHIPDAMTRVRATASQGHLSAKERHKNVKSAFAVHERHVVAIKGKTVILVDDVYTTGATAKECTKVLLKAGAAKVHVLALARVVHNQF